MTETSPVADELPPTAPIDMTAVLAAVAAASERTDRSG